MSIRLRDINAVLYRVGLFMSVHVWDGKGDYTPTRIKVGRLWARK